MRTSEQCLAKAADLEREAGLSKSHQRRQAFLELADEWRRLAMAQVRSLPAEPPSQGRLRLRRPQVN